LNSGYFDREAAKSGAKVESCLMPCDNSLVTNSFRLYFRHSSFNHPPLQCQNLHPELFYNFLRPDATLYKSTDQLPCSPATEPVIICLLQVALLQHPFENLPIQTQMDLCFVQHSEPNLPVGLSLLSLSEQIPQSLPYMPPHRLSPDHTEAVLQHRQRKVD